MPYRLFGFVCNTQYKSHIVINIQIRYQTEILKYHSYGTSEIRDLLILYLGKIISVYEYPARCRRYLSCQQFEQCRFSGTAVTDYKYKFAVLYSEIDAVKSVNSASVLEMNVNVL